VAKTTLFLFFLVILLFLLSRLLSSNIFTQSLIKILFIFEVFGVIVTEICLFTVCMLEVLLQNQLENCQTDVL